MLQIMLCIPVHAQRITLKMVLTQQWIAKSPTAKAIPKDGLREERNQGDSLAALTDCFKQADARRN